MKNLQSTHMAVLNKDEQAIMQSVANTLRELTKRAVVAWLIGMSSLLKLNRYGLVVQSIANPALLDKADEFLTARNMAKILKCESGGMI